MENEPGQMEAYEFQAYLLGIWIPNDFQELLYTYALNRSTLMKLGQSLVNMFNRANSNPDEIREFMIAVGEYIEESAEKYFEKLGLNAPEEEIIALRESLLEDLITILRTAGLL